MRHLIIGAVLLLAACADGQTPDATADTSTRTETRPQVRDATADERAECAARNGEMRRVGMLGTWQCVVTYADAGKRCTDGDQCQGDCRASIDLPPPPPAGAPVTERTRPAAPTAGDGRCQADSNQFGCYAVVEDGKAAPVICVD